jgi:tetratricopeptide (TPR) repeat protein
MLRPKKKISKREMKEDALVTTYIQVRTLYEEHKRTVSIALTAIVVLVIAGVVYINNEKANSEKATTELGKVFPLYDSGQFQKAIDGVPEQNIAGLKYLIANYGGTRSGDFGHFLLANCYYQLRKYDDALKQFQDFGTDDPLFSASRLAGMAQCYEALGKTAEAADNFEKAATKYPRLASAAEYLSDAARNYATVGKKEHALELYKRLKKNYPTTSFGRDADRFIAQLSV